MVRVRCTTYKEENRTHYENPVSHKLCKFKQTILALGFIMSRSQTFLMWILIIWDCTCLKMAWINVLSIWKGEKSMNFWILNFI
jgi:hypothetical protein